MVYVIHVFVFLFLLPVCLSFEMRNKLTSITNSATPETISTNKGLARSQYLISFKSLLQKNKKEKKLKTMRVKEFLVLFDTCQSSMSPAPQIGYLRLCLKYRKLYRLCSFLCLLRSSEVLSFDMRAKVTSKSNLATSKTCIIYTY